MTKAELNASNYNDASSEDELSPLTRKVYDEHKEEDLTEQNGVNVEGGDRTSESILKSISIKQKILLFDLILTDFLLYFCVSTPNPFFSRVVIERGGQVIQSAVILQSLMVSQTIFSVVFGKFQSKIGCKNLFLLGVTVSGLSQVAFGILQFIDNIAVFTAVGIVAHFVTGIGNAAYMVSSLTIAFQEYPNYVSKIVGFYEAAVGSAYLLGPLFGGVMYDVSGMCLPMTISGGLVLLSLPVHYAIIPKEAGKGRSEEGHFALFQFLRKPTAALLLIAYACVFGVLGYYDISFTTYVKTLGFSTTHAGIAMFTAGTAYGIFAPVSGCVVGIKPWAPMVAIIVGTIGFAASLLLFVPGQTKPLIFVACVIMGISSAVGTVPTIEKLIYIANDNQPTTRELNPNLYSGISGLVFSSLGLGMVIVPITASSIQDAIGSFSEEMFILAMMEFLIAFLIIMMCVWKRGL